jgi:TetR/AcrR family transcriptional regulator, regulator of biofilm formation and stress response
MPEGRRERPPYAEGREALLQAAARVVARDGFAGLSYRTVAREAGTTHGLVSYHFGSRDRLIHETLAAAGREAIERSSLLPTSGRLEDFARDLPRLADDAPEAQILQFELALEAQRRPELGAEVRALYDEYLAVTREALESLGIEADDALVRVVFAALDGIMLQHLVYRDAEATGAAVTALHDLLARLRR